MHPKPFHPKKPRPSFWVEEETVKKRSMRHERQVAKRVNGKTQPGSGMFEGAWNKEDVKCDADFLYQLKTSKTKSIRIDLDTLLNVTSNALVSRKNPAVAIRFESLPRGYEKVAKNWVMIPLWCWE
jgi:hypothetical protein